MLVLKSARPVGDNVGQKTLRWMFCHDFQKRSPLSRSRNRTNRSLAERTRNHSQLRRAPRPGSNGMLRVASDALTSVRCAEYQGRWFVWRLNISRARSPLLFTLLFHPAIGVPF